MIGRVLQCFKIIVMWKHKVQPLVPWMDGRTEERTVGRMDK